MITGRYLFKESHDAPLIDKVALAKMKGTYCDTCKSTEGVTIAHVDQNQEVQKIGKRIKAICIGCLYKEVYE